MVRKELLCVAPQDATPWRQQGGWDDWDIRHAADLKEAGRILRGKHYLVGLMLLDAPSGDAEAQARRFLLDHWRVSWVGVLSAGALAEPGWRRLVGDHFCDFHTHPVDSIRLRHTLGHALGHAALRGVHDGAEAAPAARETALKGRSQAIAQLRRDIAKVASAAAPVLIWGESGSGKELTAKAIHDQSVRRDGPFVPINCGAIPASLIQSELFGHERGAFTGAAREKRGLIESAAGGTVFLDEIGDLPMELQSNLLRFLQEKTVSRLGSTHSVAVDARVIAASHVNLQRAVAQGRFREDLFYRLNVLGLDVPPLRERKDDLSLLAHHFFSLFSSERAPRVKGFSSAALHALSGHDWPGNVRELINRVRRAMVMAEGQLIAARDLGLDGGIGVAVEALDGARHRAEREAIRASLASAGNNLSQAARDLGVSRMTLYRLLDKHGLAP
jgi:DNA-binding NtrC family response regulator